MTNKYHPIELSGESLLLLGLELVFWAIIAGAEAITIAVVYESDRIKEIRE